MNAKQRIETALRVYHALVDDTETLDSGLLDSVLFKDNPRYRQQCRRLNRAWLDGQETSDAPTTLGVSLAYYMAACIDADIDCYMFELTPDSSVRDIDTPFELWLLHRFPDPFDLVWQCVCDSDGHRGRPVFNEQGVKKHVQ